MLECIVILILLLGLVKLAVPNIQEFRSRSANVSARSTYLAIRESIPVSSEYEQPAVLFSQGPSPSIPFPPLSGISVPPNVRVNYFVNLPRRDAPSVLSFEVESLQGDRYFRYTSIDGHTIEQIVSKES